MTRNEIYCTLYISEGKSGKVLVRMRRINFLRTPVEILNCYFKILMGYACSRRERDLLPFLKMTAWVSQRLT